MEIHVLPAYSGDCIYVKIENHNSNFINILIDGGIARTYPQTLKPFIEKLQQVNEYIDLLIITHIDDDHIGGIVKLFEDTSFNASQIREVWFNSGESISNFFNSSVYKEREVNLILDDTRKVSIKDGITLESELKKNNLWNNRIIKKGDKIQLEDTIIDVLSPDINSLKKLNKNWQVEVNNITKTSSLNENDHDITLKKLSKNKFIKDNSVPNGSSISLLVSISNKKILILADSHASTIISSLKDLGYSVDNPIEIDIVKISHHGSSKNTNYELLKLIKCNKYIFSTNGSSHNFPNKEVFARILEVHNYSTFYFNYDNEIIRDVFLPQDREDYNFECIFLDKENYKIII